MRSGKVARQLPRETCRRLMDGRGASPECSPERKADCTCSTIASESSGNEKCASLTDSTSYRTWLGPWSELAREWKVTCKWDAARERDSVRGGGRVVSNRTHADQPCGGALNSSGTMPGLPGFHVARPFVSECGRCALGPSRPARFGRSYFMTFAEFPL